MSQLDIFKAMGEQTKHRILRELLRGELCACELPGRIGASQSNCSMHLAKLARWKIIRQRREGRKILYSIRDKRVNKLFRIMEASDSRAKATI